mgnify:CR=1 FL=1
MTLINPKKINELVTLYKNGSFKEVLKKSVSLFEKDPNNYFINNICGMANFSLSNFQKSSEFFSKTIKINPNNFEAYNNLGTSLNYLGKFKESIASYKSALKFNPNSAEILNNMGNTFRDLGKFDEAINYFIKSLNVNSAYKKAKNNIIKTLAFHNPKKSSSNPYLLANKKLQNLKINYNKEEKISDMKIKKMFNEWINIVNNYINELEYEFSQIYRLQTKDLNCERHHKVFNAFNIIPKNCFGCYKVQVNPKNVIDLIKLYLIFDQLNLKNNNNRKTFCEVRPYVASTYVGFIYCYTLEEADQVQNKLAKLCAKSIDKNIKIKIKRGCSEFSITHPNYKEINNKSKNFMKYDESWIEKEKNIDKKIPERNKYSKRLSKKHITGINLHDVLSIRNWLIYAKKINDNSYKKIYSDNLNSSFMDRTLSNQLTERINAFSSNN